MSTLVGGFQLVRQFITFNSVTQDPREAGVGCNTSSASPGGSLLPSTVIIMLALVNSAMSPAGTHNYLKRPGSAALLPVSTTSTGLLHLLVGAQVHRVRSDTGNHHVWPQPHMQHFQCMKIIGIPGWAPTEAT